MTHHIASHLSQFYVFYISVEFNQNNVLSHFKIFSLILIHISFRHMSPFTSCVAILNLCNVFHPCIY